MQAAQSTLPKLGETFHGGRYAGVNTDSEGRFYAVIKLDDKPPRRQSWDAQMDWAKGLGFDLANPVEAAMFVAAGIEFAKDGWVWLNKPEGSGCAWHCFSRGIQSFSHSAASGGGVAVRRLYLESFNPFEGATKKATASSAALRHAALALIAAADKADAALAELEPA